MGSMYIIVFLVIIKAVLLYPLAWCFGRKPPCCLKVKIFAATVYYNDILELFVNAYLEITFAVMLQSTIDLEWSTYDIYMSNILYVVFAAGAALTPFWLGYFLHTRYPRLGEEYYIETYGTAYEGIDLENNKAAVYAPLVFVVRRLILATVLI